MSTHLAFDIGGSHTRCLALTDTGAVLGFGQAPGANPNANGVLAAAENILGAAREALGDPALSSRARLAFPPSSTLEGRTAPPWSAKSALLAMAGSSHLGRNQEVSLQLHASGLTGDISFRSDILAAFISGTAERSGIVLSSGTGASATVVRDWDVADFSDGAGWLVGDYGSGFWLAQQGLRAVVNDLLGRGPATALTQAIASEALETVPEDRGELYRALLAKVYSQPPIALARFAPIVLRFADGSDPVGPDDVATGIFGRDNVATDIFGPDIVASDPVGPDDVATDIVDRAATELLRTLDSVAKRHPSPILVLAGSILSARSPVGQRVRRELSSRARDIPTPGDHAALQVFDAQTPLIGAALLLLERLGVPDSTQLRSRLAAAIG